MQHILFKNQGLKKLNQTLVALKHNTGIQQEPIQLLQWLEQQNYRFTTISPHSHATYLKRRSAENAKKALAHNLRDIFGWSMAFEAELLPPILFEALQQAGWLVAENSLWRSRIRVSSINLLNTDSLLFIHSAYPTNDEHAVFFGPDTYRFIYALQQHLTTREITQRPIKRALELCGGAGPAAITVAHYAPQAEILATDINSQALEFIKINALFNQAIHVQALHSNLFTALQGKFDLIMANPPYLVDRDKRLYRHGGGLLGAELAFNIVQQSLAHLNVGGSLFVYTGIVIANGEDLFYQHVVQHLQPFEGQFQLTYQEMDSDIFAEELEQEGYPDAERIAAVILIIERLH